MKVLFVASGNSRVHSIVPFIRSQGESLKEHGVDIYYFPVKGKGLWGYLKSAKKMREFLKENDIDLIHAHYTLSGWSAVLSFSGKPIVLSLMGSDAYGLYIGENKIKFGSGYLTLLTKIIQPFTDAILSKSANIDSYVYLKSKAHIVPNGVRLDRIKKAEFPGKEALGLDPEKTHILFLGDRGNRRKNFSLLEQSVESLQDSNLEIIAPYPVSHEKAIQYLKASDVFSMSSFMEGSPNVVKEAMACNCPMVVTDVGDVKWVIEETPGCYVSSFELEEYARQLKKAIRFSRETGRTNGIERIQKLGLDTDTVANKIIRIYNELLQTQA